MPGTFEATLQNKKPDIEDLVLLVNEGDTACYTMSHKRKCSQVRFGQPVDKVNVGDNKPRKDGVQITSVQDTQRSEGTVWGVTETFDTSGGVTPIAQAVGQFGHKNKLGDAKRKALKELGINIELRLLNSNDCVPGETSTEGTKTRGLGSWIQATAQANEPVPAAYLPSAGQIVSKAANAFVEADLEGLMQARFDVAKSKGDLCLIAGSTVKRAISEFGRTAQQVTTPNTLVPLRRYNSSDDGRVGATVKFYDSDFGSVKVILSPYVATANTGYLIDMDSYAVHTLIPMELKPLPDLGAGESFYATTNLGSMVTNPMATGKIILS